MRAFWGQVIALLVAMGHCAHLEEIDPHTASQKRNVRRATVEELQGITSLACVLKQNESLVGEAYFLPATDPCQQNHKDSRFFWVHFRDSLSRTMEVQALRTPGEGLAVEKLFLNEDPDNIINPAIKDLQFYLVKYPRARSFKVLRIPVAAGSYWIFAEKLRYAFEAAPAVRWPTEDTPKNVRLNAAIQEQLESLAPEVRVRFYRPMKRDELRFWQTGRFSQLGVQEQDSQKRNEVLHFATNVIYVHQRFANRVLENRVNEFESAIPVTTILSGMNAGKLKFYFLSNAFYLPPREESELDEYMGVRKDILLGGIPLGVVVEESLFESFWKSKTYVGPYRLDGDTRP